MSVAVVCCAIGLGFAAQYSRAHPTDRQQRLTADAVDDLPPATAACLERQHSKFAVLVHDRRCFTQPTDRSSWSCGATRMRTNGFR